MMKFYIIPLDYQNLHQRPHSKDLSAFWPPGQLAKGHQAGQLWYCCWFASGAGAAASDADCSPSLSRMDALLLLLTSRPTLLLLRLMDGDEPTMMLRDIIT